MKYIIEVETDEPEMFEQTTARWTYLMGADRPMARIIKIERAD